MEGLTINNLCRVCLKNSHFYKNIYEGHSLDKFLVYELVNDVCDLGISVDDGLPEFLCHNCFRMILKFKSFKTNALKGRSAFILLKERLEKTIIKQEELDIDGDNSEVPFEGTNDEINLGPIILKEEVLKIYRDSRQQELVESEALVCVDTVELPGNIIEYPTQELIESESLVCVDTVELPASSVEYSTQESDHGGCGWELCEEGPLRVESSDVEVTLVKTVTHSEYPQCSENKRPCCKSKGEVDADLWTRNISTNEESKNISSSEGVEASSTGTMWRLEEQRIRQGEKLYTSPLFQDEMSIGKGVRKEKDTVGEGKIGRGNDAEKGVVREREKLECYHCGNMLITKAGLIQHMKVHGFGHSFDCDVCGKVFQKNCDLIKHALIHTGSKLKMPMMLHTSSKSYECVECSEIFPHKSNLNSHMRSHTGCKPYKCSECSKTFRQIRYLQIHMRTHTGSKPYKCAECSKCFSQSNNLTVHMRSHTGSKPYKCAECSKCFSQNFILKSHMRLHTGSKPYKCAECSKCFRDYSNFVRHMKSHTELKPYTCTECTKCFLHNGDLKRHMRSHTGSKPYKCEECCKIFSLQGNLKRHIRSHTGSKPYKCAVCSKCFTQSSDLKRHMRIHTGSKPYKCAECSKSFCQNGDLKKHMRTHTGSNPY